MFGIKGGNGAGYGRDATYLRVNMMGKRIEMDLVLDRMETLLKV